MAGLNTIGVKLGYKAKGGSTEYTYIGGVLDIPELGNILDKIEVTALKDKGHVYIDGLQNNGDSMTFNCVYEDAEFKALMAIDAEQEWIVDFSETGADLTATWTGKPSVRMGTVAVGGYLSYILSITPSSEVALA